MTSKHFSLLSTLATLFGAGILLFLSLQGLYNLFYGWLAQQKYYLIWSQVAVFDIPTITPTITPTPMPIPTPTPTPQPLPAVRIMIPKIGVNAKIVEVGFTVVNYGATAKLVWDTAAYAVGHHEDSAYPGQNGNIILSGHNNTQGEVFRDLNRLEPGDTVYLYTLDKEFIYVVQTKELVPYVGATENDMLRHTQYALRTPDETLTLISCWPYVSYTHRIYITAKPY